MEAATGRGINRCSRQTDTEACPPVPVGNHLALQPETHVPPALMQRKSSGPDRAPLPELNVEPFPKRKQNVPAALKLGATPKPFKNCLAQYPPRTLEATPDQQGISPSPIRRNSLGLEWLAECARSPHSTLLLVHTPQGQAC